MHRGVHAVGHPRPTWHGRLWAALLACGGPGAAPLSHRSAVALHDLLPAPAGHAVDLTSLRRGASTRAIRVHREHDRARDARLLLAGLRVVRPTHRQVTREPRATAAPLRGLLHR